VTYTPGEIETAADWAGRPSVITRGSVTRRPDAFSFDFLTAFTQGPVALGDLTQGPVSHVWRGRMVGGQFRVSRQNDANTAWLAEATVSTPALAPEEIDWTFEQSANLVMCYEALGRVRLFWFDPTVPGFVDVDLCPGRSPRVVLDDVVDTENGDVLLFYVRPDGRLCYRQQRDRYAVEYTGPTQPVGRAWYCEDAVRTLDGRVRVLLSERTLATARYALASVDSVLYPRTEFTRREQPAVTLGDLSVVESGSADEIAIRLYLYAPVDEPTPPEFTRVGDHPPYGARLSDLDVVEAGSSNDRAFAFIFVADDSEATPPGDEWVRGGFLRIEDATQVLDLDAIAAGSALVDIATFLFVSEAGIAVPGGYVRGGFIRHEDATRVFDLDALAAGSALVTVVIWVDRDIGSPRLRIEDATQLLDLDVIEAGSSLV